MIMIIRKNALETIKLLNPVTPVTRAQHIVGLHAQLGIAVNPAPSVHGILH